MPLPEDFASESLYRPEAWFLTDASFFPDEDRIEGVCDTTRLGAFVDAQKPWPQHPKHLPGAVAVQMTGVLGQLYAIYMLGLRATEGWIGFGTHIHDARFRAIGQIGPLVVCHCSLVRKRVVRGTVFTRLAFRYEQAGKVVYESEQTAAWVQSDHRGPVPG